MAGPNPSKMFHPPYLAIYIPIHHYGTRNSCGPPKAAPTVVEAAEGNLHNGGWGDKWLNKVDKLFLKHFAFFSHRFLYPAIYCCLEVFILLSYSTSSSRDTQNTSPDIQNTSPDTQNASPNRQHTISDIQNTSPDIQNTSPLIQTHIIQNYIFLHISNRLSYILIICW